MRMVFALRFVVMKDTLVSLGRNALQDEFPTTDEQFFRQAEEPPTPLPKA